MNASYQFSHPARGGFQTLVYHVWDGLVHRFVWVTVSCDWLREEASLNDLKDLAIAQVKDTT